MLNPFVFAKVKISLRFVSWLDILDIPLGSIPYILFELEEIKKGEVISFFQHIPKALLVTK